MSFKFICCTSKVFFFLWVCAVLIYEYAVVYLIILLLMDSWVAYSLRLLLLRLMWIFFFMVNICTHVSWATYTSWGTVEGSIICKVYSMCKDIASPSATLPMSGCLACFYSEIRRRKLQALWSGVDVWSHQAFPSVIDADTEPRERT